MSNVFDKIGDIKNNIRRNNFDWSHDNNFTTALGRITPVLCELCPPNSSLKIKPTYGLQFMPMMFPVQTKVKAFLSFFRVPLRALWKDYADYISSPNEESTLEPPYINFPASSFSENGALGVSSLADYLGIPCTVTLPDIDIPDASFDPKGFAYTDKGLPVAGSKWSGVKAFQSLTTGGTGLTLGSPALTTYNCIDIGAKVPDVDGASNGDQFGTTVHIELTGNESLVDNLINTFTNAATSEISSANTAPFYVVSTYRSDGGSSGEYVTNVVRILARDLNVGVNAQGKSVISFDAPLVVVNSSVLGPSKIYLFAPPTNVIWNADGSMLFTKTATFMPSSAIPLTDSTCPYLHTSSGGTKGNIKISAFAFRAYECCYNAYIRNIRNNPFVLDGKNVYNRFITNNDGGADSTTPLELKASNWASDMFTTALPSPQQGKAPLVGLTTYTETSTSENGEVRTVQKFAMVDEDGKKYQLSFTNNDEALTGVTYTQLNADTPVRPVSSLYDVVTSGISINDFRNVNAYQRYLELNQFRGYSYKDIVEGRFDVKIHYDALLMPEYLGGITRDVVINPVTQTVETSSTGTYAGSLGSQAGLGLLRGETDSDISCFCDEESIVIGLLSVVPMPVYTQVLPKHFLYRERLDSFNPEFDQIGYQPIKMSELCPVQQYITDPAGLDKVFGYQRPWYEYVQKLDAAHGLFRTQLRNFLMNRVFSKPPVLGGDFTTVDASQVNDVFSVTETTDKILGQIHFDITAKLPISRVVVPKLE